MSSVRPQLESGLTQLGLSVDLAPPLLAYLDLLNHWNKVHNLSAVRSQQQQISTHLLDSLAVARHLAPYARVADIGSGAGLPGIPLALAQPQQHWFLVEPAPKKAAFLAAVQRELGLIHVEIIPHKAQQWSPSIPVNAMISRAFADISQLLELAPHRVDPTGVVWAMKGQYPAQELAALPAACSQVWPLQVPFLSASRHLVAVYLSDLHRS